MSAHGQSLLVFFRFKTWVDFDAENAASTRRSVQTQKKRAPLRLTQPGPLYGSSVIVQ